MEENERKTKEIQEVVCNIPPVVLPCRKKKIGSVPFFFLHVNIRWYNSLPDSIPKKKKRSVPSCCSSFSPPLKKYWIPFILAFLFFTTGKQGNRFFFSLWPMGGAFHLLVLFPSLKCGIHIEKFDKEKTKKNQPKKKKDAYPTVSQRRHWTWHVHQQRRQQGPCCVSQPYRYIRPSIPCQVRQQFAEQHTKQWVGLQYHWADQEGVLASWCDVQAP